MAYGIPKPKENMAKSNLSDVHNNDLSSSFSPYDFGPPANSENNPTRPLPGSGGQDDNQATPEAKRAGYGHQYIGPNDDSLSHAGPHPGGGSPRAPMGGHNLDERGQYTVRMKRGSSL